MSSNRGRIQVQGGEFEDSESWASDEPLTAEEGLNKLEVLRNRIPKTEAELREKEFEKARNFINSASEKGGVDAPVSKTFKRKGSRDVRVDIEVIRGRAFVVLLVLAAGIVYFWTGGWKW